MGLIQIDTMNVVARAHYAWLGLDSVKMDRRRGFEKLLSRAL